MLALKDGDRIAVTFYTYTPPFKIFYFTGIIHRRVYDGTFPEWNQAGERAMGKEGTQAFYNMDDGMLKAGVLEMVRMAVNPTWVSIPNFETRFPCGIEKGLEAIASVM